MELSKIRPFIEITRIIDGFTMGLGMVVGAIVAGSLEIDIPIQFYLILIISGSLVTSHTMVINDIIDLEIDKINVPERVLPSGRLTITSAFIFSLILAFTGVLGFVLIDHQKYVSTTWTWLFVTIHIILSDLYSWKLKKTGLLGNFVVAYMSYALFLFADIFVNGSLTALPTIFGMIAFLISLSREVLKGIMDTQGDSEHGINTLAVRRGKSFAKYFAIVLQMICLILGIILFFELIWVGKVGVILFLGMMLFSIKFSEEANDIETAKMAKSFLLYIPLAYSPFIIINQILSQ